MKKTEKKKAENKRKMLARSPEPFPKIRFFPWESDETKEAEKEKASNK